jgi:nitronate monooxygenase
LSSLLQTLGINLPIIQAPMASVSTPAMAAAVSNAGGLGSIGVRAAGALAARETIAAVRAATDRPFNVNVFCNRPAVANPSCEGGLARATRPRGPTVRC